MAKLRIHVLEELAATFFGVKDRCGMKVLQLLPFQYGKILRRQCSVKSSDPGQTNVFSNLSSLELFIKVQTPEGTCLFFIYGSCT